MDSIKISQALSDPIRYKILMMLANSEKACCPVTSSNDLEPVSGLCNCEIMSELGMIQSRVSYHMKELLETGLVYEEPRGKWRYYFLNRQKIVEYIEQLKLDFNF
jgi:Predicted transcriptional regulators